MAEAPHRAQPRATRAAASARAPSWTLDARGRAAVRALLLSAALACAIGVGAVAGSVALDEPAPSGAVHAVREGESLWSVAAAVAGPGEDVRDVAAQIARLNGLAGSTLHAGQRLELPAP